MKRIFYFLVFAALLSSCMSSRKMLNKGYYDMAIEKAVKKLKKKPAKDKQIVVLRDAYRLANQVNTDRVSFLRKEGRPDVWEEIFNNYSYMKIRQEKVRVLPTSVLNALSYVYVDYDQEIISAKQHAAEYFYAHAMQLIDTKQKTSSRQAYDELAKVKSYYPTYKDVDQKLQIARAQGMSYVIFQMKNATRVPLPPDFESELTKISLQELNNFWTLFDTREVKDRNYDYAVLVNMKEIMVSPEQSKEVERVETQKVQDGYEYLLDSKGNVRKDSLGNDLKVPKYKDLKCFVTEFRMHKVAKIAGSIDFVNLASGQLMRSSPIASEYAFDYSWANAKGDMTAASAETKKMLNNRPMPFPNDFGMLLNTGQILKNMTKDIIFREKALFY